MNILTRSSNSINIASFWENFQLKKYNFDPSYQRRGDVWTESKKRFLIDTILKNFPMPPIFLHQKIKDEDGSTEYEIIDGKQRLQSIIDFIKGEIAIPDNFSEDGFGDDSLDGQYFKDLTGEKGNEYKKLFWRYSLSIEYIDSDDDEVINNIFDRLNRNGEPLNPQELRKAKYSKSNFYKLAVEKASSNYWHEHLSSLEINRYDDVEFVSELLFVILEDGINDASMKDRLDQLYADYCTDNNKDFTNTSEVFDTITNYLANLHLDLNRFRINSVSHLYGLWGFSWMLYKNNKLAIDYSKQLIVFFTALRRRDFSNEYVNDYRQSMQSNTKSKSNRIKRINALLGFCNISAHL